MTTDQIAFVLIILGAVALAAAVLRVLVGREPEEWDVDSESVGRATERKDDLL